MTRGADGRGIRPARIVALARTVDERAFAQAIDVPLLLVRLDDAVGGEEGELATALDEVFETGGVRVDAGLAFRTASVADDMRQGSGRPGPGVFGPEQLKVRLIRSPYFAVPLRKRAGGGKSFTERISIGRARNNDVVLRHESVSKFHAWIARDEDDAYYVADGPSRNGTTVNGLRTGSSLPSRIANGDVLRFGSVEALLTDAPTLWGALR